MSVDNFFKKNKTEKKKYQEKENSLPVEGKKIKSNNKLAGEMLNVSFEIYKDFCYFH